MAQLPVVLSDDTGSYADQAAGYDPSVFGFLNFAQAFLAKQLD